MIKQLLYLILVLSMVFSVMTGCGDKRETKKKSSTVSKDDKKPITFKIFIAETDANPDKFASPVAKEVQKRTGVTLKIENSVSSDTGQQKISLMAASGEYPDLVFAKGDLDILKDQDALVKLDDMIEKYGPNIKKFYGDQFKRLKWSLQDPSIYYFGGGVFGQESMEPTGGFQLQHAVVKELGYPKLETLSDFENAIKAYKDKHPKIDGQTTIGYSILADDWRFMITVSNPACFSTGGADDGEWYVDQDTYKVKRHLTRQEEKEYFRWLNHMNDIGLLDPESFIQKSDQYNSKIATGRVLGLSDARWGINEPVTALKRAGKIERTYGYYPLVLKKGMKQHEFQDSGYVGGWGFAITKSCKDPVRAVKFFDWLCTEESNILRNWGVEGVHYTIVNGKRVWKDEVKKANQSDTEFAKNTGIGKYQYPYPFYGNAIMDSTGQSYSPTGTLGAIIENQTPIENDILSHYNAKSWKDLFLPKSAFKVKPYGVMYLLPVEDDNIKAKEQKILKLGYQMIPAAVKAKPEDFDKNFDAYLNAIKAAGLAEVTAAYQKALNDRMKLWKYN